MSVIAVSSFSLHDMLGPLHLDVHDEDGNLTHLEIPKPALYSLEEFGVLARERLGVKAIELCQIQFADSSPERVAALRSSLDRTGGRVLTVVIDIGDLAGATPEHRRADVVAITRWLDIAQALGARYARVNMGNPLAGESSADRSGFLDAMRQLSLLAVERDLRLLVENHGGETSDPDYLIALQEELGVTSVGILLDLGNFEPINTVAHARFAGTPAADTGLETDVVYDRIAALAPHADLVHAKAYDPASDGTPLLDLERALAIVADSGYSGDLTIEWEGLEGDPLERTAQTISTTRRFFPQHE